LKDSKDLCCRRWTLRKPVGAIDMEAMVRPVIAHFVPVLPARRIAGLARHPWCGKRSALSCRIGDFSAAQTSYVGPNRP